MSIWQPTESQLRDAGSLKWTGMERTSGSPALGAWVAEMDFGTAPVVKDALVRAIESGLLGYPPPWAQEATADALVPFLERRFGWDVKRGWVRTFQTILGALHHTIDHLTRPGSAVVVPTPAYMPFLTIPGQHGRDVIEVPSLHDPQATTDEGAWALDLEGIEAALADGAGLVILCNPWNPTGRVFSVQELRALNAVVSRYDALVFADEVHSPLVYPNPFDFTPYASLGPSFQEHTVTAIAASKAWNVAGLMAAQVIIPDEKLREKWDEAQGRNSPCALGSVAAITAYTEGDEWLAQVLKVIERNLDVLGAELEGTAVDYHRPQGTYLAWLGFEAYDLASCPQEILLEEYGVATNAGETLGVGYECWSRVNVAMSEDLWRVAAKRIGDFARSAPLKTNSQ